jgi:hypothetical protein
MAGTSAVYAFYVQVGTDSSTLRDQGGLIDPQDPSGRRTGRWSTAAVVSYCHLVNEAVLAAAPMWHLAGGRVSDPVLTVLNGWLPSQWRQCPSAVLEELPLRSRHLLLCVRIPIGNYRDGA